jgi:hypothetical protein
LFLLFESFVHRLFLQGLSFVDFVLAVGSRAAQDFQAAGGQALIFVSALRFGHLGSKSDFYAGFYAASPFVTLGLVLGLNSVVDLVLCGISDSFLILISCLCAHRSWPLFRSHAIEVLSPTDLSLV